VPKLAAKRAREIGRADPREIDLSARLITQALPASVAADARKQFIIQARTAVEAYLAYLPRGQARRRRHRAAVQGRHAPKAHRPSDPLRHGLIGELFDAWMTMRESLDPDGVRGFKRAADAVLGAAGLPAVSEREQRQIRKQIATFVAALASEG
jgi:hypothetical protein